MASNNKTERSRRRAREAIENTRTVRRSATAKRREASAHRDEVARAGFQRHDAPAALVEACMRGEVEATGRDWIGAMHAVLRGASIDGCPDSSSEHSPVGQFRAAMLEIARRHPRLLTPECVRGLAHIAPLPWLRPCHEWRPKARGRGALWRSLVDHVIGGYPVPRLLYAALDTSAANAQLFAWLAQGKSAFTAAQQGLLPATLTRRMCHLLMTTRGQMDVAVAVRQAQVTALGGDARLAAAISATSYGEGFEHPVEPFRHDVIHWLCRQPMLDPGLVGPLVDYFTHRKRDDDGFGVRGRSLGATMLAMDAWHADLNRQAAMEHGSFPPSGLRSSFAVSRLSQGPGAQLVKVTAIVELLTSRELRREGTQMHHCVASYGGSIKKGLASIWSLRTWLGQVAADADLRGLAEEDVIRTSEAKSVATIEVRLEKGALVQVRGPCNAKVEQATQRVIEAWALDNRVGVARGAFLRF